MIVMVCFFVFLISAAFLLSKFKEPLTGNVVAGNCLGECHNNSECEDNDPCTMDGCAYPGTCSSRCIYDVKEGCKH